MASDFMKSHTSSAAGLKSGQFNRKRNSGNVDSYKLHGIGYKVEAQGLCMKSVLCNRVWNFMKMALDFMKFHKI